MRCRADSAQATCPWRHEAVRKDVLRYSHEARAWIWWATPLYIWPVVKCPGCGGDLPDLAVIVKDWQVNGWPDEGAE